MAFFDTVANVVSDAAIELGLGSVSDVFASTDANVIQLRTFLKRLGRKLCAEYQWPHLRREFTFTTTSGVAVSGGLNADFLTMVDGAGWNRSTDYPFVPTSAQVWQQIQATGAQPYALMFLPSFTYDNGPSDHRFELKLIPTPTVTGDTIAFVYQSRWWVTSAPNPEGIADKPTANTHILMFDPSLLVCGLKLEWQRAKGFDTAATQADYDEALAQAKGASVMAAPTLSLTPRTNEGLYWNVPETGFGS